MGPVQLVGRYHHEVPTAQKWRLRHRVNLGTLFGIMGRATKSNLPQDQPLKWNVEKAAQEFGLSIMTLRKALAKTSATPDADGLFTTRQIIDALHGALDQERLRTQRELTKKYAIANAVAEATFLDRAEIAKALSALADAMTSRILSSELSRSAKEDLLRELSSVPLILEETAQGQTRLPRGNGTRNGDNGSEG